MKPFVSSKVDKWKARIAIALGESIPGGGPLVPREANFEQFSKMADSRLVRRPDRLI